MQTVIQTMSEFQHHSTKLHRCLNFLSQRS